MSTSSVNVSSTAGSPISIAGLASGLNTTAIISALMAVEREPVTHLTDEQARVQGEQTQLQTIQTSLQTLAGAVSEFGLPGLFEESQTVTSSEPARVSAAATVGAAVGGYEVEVTQLANSAQRTFTFTSPKSEDTITIEGHEFKLKAEGTAKELAQAINSESKAGVFAAALENGTIVLSSRKTGESEGEFIKVSDAGGTLVEKAGTAKAGQDAKYKVDEVEMTSASNVVSDAIPGVTLTLSGLTPQGPVTIDVQPPGPNVTALEGQVNAFIKTYNTTVEAIEKQLNTKPPVKPQTASEFASGTLFGDLELTNVLSDMRQTMYETIPGLEGEMSSPLDIGISTGAGTGGATSQASLNGMLQLNATKLTEALKTNPTGVQKMLEQWSSGLQKTINDAAAPGGSIEGRVNVDLSEVTQITSQITTMNELLANREKALQHTYAELEAVISQNNAQDAFLTKQAESLGNSNSSSSG
ncbi:MAG TPA: flagellar filament capping protein FliD [Solirubrobacteraceae bacterium]|jgi:flagellar hook-associated protein 2|nr:flagellar filament capping protein FliD [Solirubrobacteraceae bacterium]